MRAISSVELTLLASQLLDLRRRVRLGAEDDLAEQVEDGIQPGLGTDEIALGCRARTHCSAFSTAGVASKCGSSLPSG